MLPPFSLAAVLALRQQKEDSEERALAAIARQKEELQTALLRLQQELAQAASARAHEVQTVRSAAQHQAAYTRYQLLCDAQTELHTKIGALERQQREQRVLHLAARSARETLSALRTQQAAAWEKEQQARAAKRLDDLFAARWIRRK